MSRVNLHRLARFLAILAIAALALATRASAQATNILIIVLDDVGTDVLGSDIGDVYTTPNMDQLAAEGVVFRNAWVNPLCAATRATLMTGRYSFRTGVGGVRPRQEGSGLSDDEVFLPEMLGAGYESAALGKWHLTGRKGGAPNYSHPRDNGFGHFSGTLNNLIAPETYFTFEKVVDDFPMSESGYATTVTTDDAIAAIQSMSEPWLTYVAFHAAHRPLHWPPSHLHSEAYDLTAADFEHSLFRAIVESADTEIGRMLAAIPADVRSRTTVIVLGDNGTSGISSIVNSPLRSKGTVYQSGVNVPFIVAGSRVPSASHGASSGALIDGVDLLATVAEIAGTPAGSTDSISFLPYLADPELPSLRSYSYAERFPARSSTRFHRQALRDERYKLIRRDCLYEEMYDLAADPDETTDLLTLQGITPEAALSLAALGSELDGLTGCRTDGDMDGIFNHEDNCVDLPNPAQIDSDIDGFGNACDADFDGNGMVDFGDMQMLHAALGLRLESPDYDPVLDLDSDGILGGTDVSALRSLVLRPPGPSGLACAGQTPCASP